MKYLVPIRERNSLISSTLINKEFETKQEAIEYCQSLNFPAKIYELVAESTINVSVDEKQRAAS